MTAATGWAALVARREGHGVDTDWERVPHDPARARRVDTLGRPRRSSSTASLGVELLRSIDALGAQEDSWLWPHVAVAARHRAPRLASTLAAARAAGLSLHLFVFGITHAGGRGVDAHAGRLLLRPLHRRRLGARPAGDARGRRRRRAADVRLARLAVRGRQRRRGGDEPRRPSASPRQGLFSPPAAYVVYTLLVNVVYFGGAIIGGQAAWRAALQRDRLAEQARTIDAQATSLQRQAVVEERLRIARELHDVVAHHVSVIGIQAAAARRVLRRDPDVAAGALRSVETSSREAVAQMRGLLGTLRDSGDGRAGPDGARAPEPGLADVPALVAEAATAGLAASSATSSRTAPARRRRAGTRSGSRSTAPRRRRWPTCAGTRPASAATVFVRVDRRPEHGFAHGYAEVEVLDDGRPRSGTSGTGLGLLGVRERLAAAWRRRARSGRASTGGYRVRVRMPLPEDAVVSRARLRVLLVDDQQLVRSGFSLILSVEDDLEVVGEASDGAEAVRLTRELRPDVVLMDVQMPVMDGIEATRAHRRRRPGQGRHPHHLRPRRLRLRRPRRRGQRLPAQERRRRAPRRGGARRRRRPRPAGARGDPPGHRADDDGAGLGDDAEPAASGGRRRATRGSTS